MFREPLVQSTRGGQGGGAVMTEAGREVLDLYRAFEQQAAEAAAGSQAALQARPRDISNQK